MFSALQKEVYLFTNYYKKIYAYFAEAPDGSSQISGGDLDPDKFADNIEEIIDEYPPDCCPDCCYVKFPFLKGDESDLWLRWDEARKKSYALVEHKYFETIIITMILISSLALVSLFI